jgi:hypothetical protein
MKRYNFQEVWLISVWLCLGGVGLTADPSRPTTKESDHLSLRPPLQVFVQLRSPVKRRSEGRQGSCGWHLRKRRGPGGLA